MKRIADSFLQPDWNVSSRIRAYVTTRRGGVSKSPYDSLNLATHVGDSPEAVSENRKILRERLDLPAEPLWLEQVHGTNVVQAGCSTGCIADASYTDNAGNVCVVMTADCLPVFLASDKGDEVAVAHAGWKGLLQGVIEEAVTKFSVDVENIHAWLGPAIGPENFEVGAEVRQAFLDEAMRTKSSPGSSSFPRRRESSESADLIDFAFRPVINAPGKYLADIYELARIRLKRMGVKNISGGEFCTVENREMFYSYRRDGVTGRMASLIWIE